jgi:hypothetical protein
LNAFSVDDSQQLNKEEPSKEALNKKEFNIRSYDKNSESDYFFFLHQNQNIFPSNIGKY